LSNIQAKTVYGETPLKLANFFLFDVSRKKKKVTQKLSSFSKIKKPKKDKNVKTLFKLELLKKKKMQCTISMLSGVGQLKEKHLTWQTLICRYLKKKVLQKPSSFSQIEKLKIDKNEKQCF
jgi:hypothetical protein